MGFTEKTASSIGKLGRAVNSERQKKASRENGKHGGRPRKKLTRAVFARLLNDGELSDIEEDICRSLGIIKTNTTLFGNWLKKTYPEEFKEYYKKVSQEAEK
jgi:hypothetical protein